MFALILVEGKLSTTQVKDMNNHSDLIEEYFLEQRQILGMVDKLALQNAINVILEAYQKNSMIFTCGNGGSAHTASHYITDWNKMVDVYCNRQFKGVCLNDNVGNITAYANDISYEEVFARMLRSYLSKNDLVIMISGSGNSENLLQAAKCAKDFGASTLGLIGYDGGKLRGCVDDYLIFPSFDMQLCEDFHLSFGHIVMKALISIGVTKNDPR